LKAAYENWWTLVSSHGSEESSIPISDRKTWIHAGDIRANSGDGPWEQSDIKSGLIFQGYWEVNVIKAGKYRISMRRWPPEVDVAIRGGVPGGKTFSGINLATVNIQGQKLTVPVGATDKEVYVDATLNADPTPSTDHLQATFTGGVTVGAYFVSIEPIQ